MSDFKISIQGLKELKAAIERNPQMVTDETKKFLQRAVAAHMRTIINTPWRMGGSGGGVPVAMKNGGNLKDSHRTEFRPFEARIFPEMARARYAGFVHEGTRKMHARPWLDYALQKNSNEVVRLSNELLANLVGDLAK